MRNTKGGEKHMNTVQLIRQHNEKINEAFKKAEGGEIINLTDLFISKEKVLKRLGKRYPMLNN